jgi:retron-type reverse transcriptase
MGLRQRRHKVVDVDLSRYFDTIRHCRILTKVARRVVDDKVLAMVKQFLMDDAFAVSRMREIRLSGSMWRGPETE